MSSGVRPARHSEWIGRCVRDIREGKRMTQKFLAMRLHISQNQLCKYERGVDRIAFEMMVEIADILRVPLDRFRPPADVLEAARLEGRDPLLAALRRQQAEGGRAGA